MLRLVVSLAAVVALLLAAGPAQGAALQGPPRVVGVDAYLPKRGAHAGRLVVDVYVRYRGVRRAAVARLLRARARHVGVVRVHSLAGGRARRLGGDRLRMPLRPGRATHRIVVRRPRGAVAARARLRLRVTVQARLDRVPRRRGVEERRTSRATRSVVARATAAPDVDVADPRLGIYESKNGRVLMEVAAIGSRMAVTQMVVESPNSPCTALYQNQQGVIGADGTFAVAPTGNGQHLILGQFQTPGTAYVVWSLLDTQGCVVPAGSNTVTGPSTGA